MHLTFTISDTASPRVEALRRTVSGRQAKQAIGIGLRKVTRTHLRALPPNEKFPEATTGFYRAAAESITAPQTDDEGVTISITQLGMRQRFRGGPIAPGPDKQYLTIAAQGFAYGHRAGEFNDLHFGFALNEEGYLQPALIENEQQAVRLRKTKDGLKAYAGQVHGSDDTEIEVTPVFWLIRGAMQDPDPGVLPTEEELTEAAIGALTSLIRRRLHDPAAQVEIEEEDES